MKKIGKLSSQMWKTVRIIACFFSALWISRYYLIEEK